MGSVVSTGGVLLPLADDGENLRRVYLDFSGKPPSVDVARKFMADVNSRKRQELIGELLGAEDCPCRMQEARSAMLLERRTDTVVPNAEWREEVFALYQAEERIATEVVENMRGWKQSDQGVDQSARRKRRQVVTARVGRCRASGSTSWTPYRVRHVGVRWR